MRVNFKQSRAVVLALAAFSASASLSAQEQLPPASDPNIVVNGVLPADMAELPQGPDIKGVITARRGERIQVTSADGANTIVAITDATQIKASSGPFGLGRGRLGADALLNGLPVTVKTVQTGAVLAASKITFRGNDLKTARMIQGGTAQRFDEQSAATEALRGRMGDIDKYNIKSTTNAYFDTGKAVLSARAKADLCAAAAQAEAMDNALMLVVGYTDSVGSQEYNQALSERRAGAVINYLQQACHWKPYRMLTPTGMAEADPLASNDTAAGKAQNRRVSVNVLVSKGLDGM
ncbi:OmpA family protein [Novosphingobium sp. Chol11]|uniref:OmpA family protein n=1 Tax=Novosphingobium sp. Chol11 TaxID=1385763 RepID=UPI0025F6BE33|nr:OmpA family protein [Novosphingobium sp. Chol11]